MLKILLVDDDPDLRDLLTYGLRRDGYSVLTAPDGQQALELFRRESPALVLLDGNLPEMDGFQVCRQIRQEARTPVIMLTARDEEEDVVRGLKEGADDYVTKPFSYKTLAARMEAVLRRSDAERYRPAAGALKIGNLKLDLESYEVTQDDQPVELTRVQFRILYMLALNLGRVVPHARLIEYGCGYPDGTFNVNLLKTHISHIRKKLGLPVGEGGIKSVFGVGYSLSRAVGEPTAASACLAA